MNNRIFYGHTTPWWDQSYKELDYQYLPLKNTQEVQQQWQEQGFGCMRLNGGLYDMSRPLPSIAEKFFTLFDWQNVGISFYCMQTCDFLPLHSDHFITYRKKYNIQDPYQVWRAVVFLENWKSGHYFEIDNTPIMPWKAGDWVAWNYDIRHAAGNVGADNRYTVQITGQNKNFISGLTE